MNESIYRDIIIDNYKNPMNRGSIVNANAIAEDSNPLCGDTIKIEMKIKDNKVEDIKFNGSGCAISTASASLLTENAKGKSNEEILKLSKDYVMEMLGVELSALRVKCALLPLKVIKLAVLTY